MNQPKSAKGTWTLTHALSDRALVPHDLDLIFNSKSESDLVADGLNNPNNLNKERPTKAPTSLGYITSKLQPL
jgi:hypothetical protein